MRPSSSTPFALLSPTGRAFNDKSSHVKVFHCFEDTFVRLGRLQHAWFVLTAHVNIHQTRSSDGTGWNDAGVAVSNNGFLIAKRQSAYFVRTEIVRCILQLIVGLLIAEFSPEHYREARVGRTDAETAEGHVVASAKIHKKKSIMKLFTLRL